MRIHLSSPYTPVKIALPVTLLLLTLAGCSSSTEVNKENFSEAIGKYLTENPKCAWFLTSRVNKKTDVKDPTLDIFVRAGLLNKDISGPIRLGEMNIKYSLTEAGKSASMTNGKGLMQQTGLCYGIQKLVEVTGFDEPGKNSIDVEYDYQITLEDWAKQKVVLDFLGGINNPARKDIKGGVISASTSLSLKGNGWKMTKQN